MPLLGAVEYYGLAVFYLLANIVLSAGLMVLEYRCLNHPADSFVQDICLSNTNMRTVLAAILAVQALFIVWQLGDTACALRVWLMSRRGGINEGAFIAMGMGASFGFKLRAFILPGYTLYLLAIILFQYGTGLVQPLSNLFIQTVSVYQETRSTASVFDAPSFYNVSDPISPPGFFAGVNLVADMRTFSSGANSVREGAAGSVSTNVLRKYFISVSNMVDGDASNAVKHEETVAVVNTTCLGQTSILPLGDYLSQDSKYILVNTTLLDALSGEVLAEVFSIKLGSVQPNRIVFTSSFVTAFCNDTACSRNIGSSPLYAAGATCTSIIELSVSELVYTISTRNVKMLTRVSNETSVNALDLARLVVNQTIAPEVAATELLRLPFASYDYNLSIVDQFSTYEEGLFDDAVSNVVHSRICAGVANSLLFLWSAYGAGEVGNNGKVGNNYYALDKNVPLYKLVPQVYVRPFAMWMLTGALIIVTFLVCVAGIVGTWACGSIKPHSDLSLVDDMDQASIEVRAKLNLANDPGAQRAEAFNRKLYKRAAMEMDDKRYMTNQPPPPAVSNLYPYDEV